MAIVAVLLGARIARAQELELDRVIAVVNGDVILASELDRRMVGATVTKKATDPRKAMLWAMIDELLMVQLAHTNGVSATDEEVDRAVAEIRSTNQLTEKQLLDELGKQGYSLADYRTSVRHQIVALKIINILVRPGVTVTDDDAKKLFDERVKAAGKKPIPEFKDVKEELRRELYTQRLDLARDRMTVELRAQAFIDIRLPEGSS